MLRRLLTLFQPETANPDPGIVETAEVDLEHYRLDYTPLFGETVAALGFEPDVEGR